MILVGTRKALLRFEDDGAYVDAAFEGLPCNLAVGIQGSLFAALDHGHWGQKLHRKAGDQGWAEIAAPAYPEDTGKSLEYIWALADGLVPGRVWLGTNPGGLFRSDDGGDSWTLVRGLWDHPSRPDWFGGGRDTPGIHCVTVDPRDPERLHVGVSCAGVFETRDGGATWQPRNRGLRADFLPDPSAEVGQDPHMLARCQSDPDVIWQQNHCGVWVSRDSGASWQEKTQGNASFGFGVVCDGPDEAWVVPAVSDEQRCAVGGAMRVCHTRDGGATWRELTEGLPQELCYDLVYRHAFAMRGDTLVMGSTTGNLWISRDRGERWELLSHSLAPVYSVQFA
jgi:photosystem II stability/assembly factor-like uncharacterized protein